MSTEATSSHEAFTSAPPSRNTSFFLKAHHAILPADLASKQAEIDYCFLSLTPTGGRVHDSNEALMSLSRIYELGNASKIDQWRVESRVKASTYGYEPQYLYFRPIFSNGTHKVSEKDLVIAVDPSVVSVFNQEIRDNYSDESFSEGEAAYLKTKKPFSGFAEQVTSNAVSDLFQRAGTIKREWMVSDEDDQYFFGTEENTAQYLPEVVMDAEEIKGLFVPHEMIPEELKM